MFKSNAQIVIPQSNISGWWVRWRFVGECSFDTRPWSVYMVAGMALHDRGMSNG